MKASDWISITVLTWAALTLPIYILSILYLGSWENFLEAFEFEGIRSLELSDLGVIVFFVCPWLIIVAFTIWKLISKIQI